LVKSPRGRKWGGCPNRREKKNNGGRRRGGIRRGGRKDGDDKKVGASAGGGLSRGKPGISATERGDTGSFFDVQPIKSSIERSYAAFRREVRKNGGKAEE